MSDVMESAGRILPMPKLDYDASKTFYMLDIVNHNGATWICRKECTGQEPSDTNTEYWQRFGGDNAKTLDGHGAEYFVERTKETLSTSILEKALTLDNGMHNFVLAGYGNYLGDDLPSATYAYGNATVEKRANEATVILWGRLNSPIAVNYYAGEWSGWHTLATLTDLAKYLPLTGGTIGSNEYTPLTIKNTNYNHSIIGFNGLGGALGWLGFQTTNTPAFRSTDGVYNALLHTGNKPTGTYTGNGSATERTVNIGGIGKLLYISDTHYLNNALIGAFGGIAWNYQGGSVRAIAIGQASFTNGILNMNTDDDAINKAGVPHDYTLL